MIAKLTGYGCTTSWVRQLLSLTNLAPDIIGQVLSGELSGKVSLDDLRTAAETLEWELQRRVLTPP